MLKVNDTVIVRNNVLLAFTSKPCLICLALYPLHINELTAAQTDDLVHHCHISIANTMQIPQPCIKPYRGHFNVKTPSYQYRDSYHKDKIISMFLCKTAVTPLLSTVVAAALQ